MKKRKKKRKKKKKKKGKRKKKMKKMRKKKMKMKMKKKMKKMRKKKVGHFQTHQNGGNIWRMIIISIKKFLLISKVFHSSLKRRLKIQMI
jgi:hypothetical protein